MELIYLWVEEYKNIKRQGFNFSPKFTCHYDEKTNELTINENDNYVSIFPDNINITAIVGQNGSGKSALLELIMLSFYTQKIQEEKEYKNWLLAYDKSSQQILISSFLNQESISFNNISIESKKKNNKLKSSFKRQMGKYYFDEVNSKNLQNIHYNPSSELISSSFLHYIIKSSQEYYGNIYDMDFKPTQN